MTFFNVLIQSIKQQITQFLKFEVIIKDNVIIISNKHFFLLKLSKHLKNFKLKFHNFVLISLQDLFFYQHSQIEFLMIYINNIMKNFVFKFTEKLNFTKWHSIVNDINTQYKNDIIAIKTVFES